MPYLKVWLLAPLSALLLAMPVAGSAQGWYMLTPPVVVRGVPVVNETAPLSQWRPSQLYESAHACEETRLQWVTSLKRFEGSLRRARALKTRCIAATDPRRTSESTSAATSQTGWYLLTPPRQGPRPSPSEQEGSLPSTERMDPSAPLVHWSHHRSFDTETECETARQDLGTGPGQVQNDRAGALCIFINDRRLASDGTPSSASPR
jgi:hypothetical protein